MQRKGISALALSIAAVGFLAGRATSTTSQDAEAGVQEAAMPMPAMPGKMHRVLDALEGTFDLDLTMWMGPEPMTATSVSKKTWILGGRFLKEEVEGEFMGQPFEGLGLMGWSDVDQTYKGVWVDNSSNEMFMSTTGKLLDDGNTIMSITMDPDPRTGEMVKAEDVTVIQGPNKHTYTKYMIADDGSKQKSMEIVYTRK